MTPAEVIREARNILFERGWGRVQMIGVGGEPCMEAALTIALLGRPTFLDRGQCATVNAVIDAVKAALPGDDTLIWLWNDQPGRTFDEVIDVLDRAEKIAEEAS